MKKFKALFAVLAITALLCALLTPRASAQVEPNAKGTFDNVPALVTAGVASNVVSTAVSVPKGRGIAIIPTFSGTNSGTANFTCYFNVSHDKTNWTTTAPFTMVTPMNGANAVRDFKLFPPSSLDNMPYIRLQAISNAHTSTLIVSNIAWSVQ